jgi:hypothetical protein
MSTLDQELSAEAVMLYLVDPVGSFGRLVDQGWQLWLVEAEV